MKKAVWCRICEDFTKQYVPVGGCVICARRRANNWRKANPEKVKEQRKKYPRDPERERLRGILWRKNNPEKSRQHQNKYAKGSIEVRRAAQRRRQGLPLVTKPRTEECEVPGCLRKVKHLDHCHVSGKFRGWLCAQHNMGIGLIGDTLAAALAVVEYLRRVEA